MQAQGRRSSTSKKCATKHVLEKSETATNTKFKKSPDAKHNGEVACIVNREPRSLAVASVSGLSLSWDTVGYLPVAKLGPLGELPNDVDDFGTYS